MAVNTYPLPADELSTLYEVKSHELVLSAKGSSQPVTFDIHFRRMTILGGLKFELLGSVLPIMETPKPYYHQQRIKMPAPTVTDVIIAYAGDLNGKPVPIHFTGLGGENSAVQSSASTPSTQPQTLMLEDEQINVINGHIFKIKAPSAVPKLGSIHMDHDDYYVKLQTAGIQDKDVFWTFKAVKPTTNTQVQLFFAGGLENYVYRIVYNVFIGLADVQTVMVTNDGLIERFTARVNDALNIVKAQYPEAELHRADAEAEGQRPCSSPEQLENVIVVCDVGDRKWATTSSRNYAPWTPVVISERLLDTHRSVPWPVEMDASRADELMKAQGFTMPYTHMSLEYPISQSLDNEPQYVFKMEQIFGGPREVFVGVNSGKVVPIGQVLPPKV